MPHINDAWRVLSDPRRRARWDRDHTVVEPPQHWAPTPAGPTASPMPRPRPSAPPSRMDSGWVAFGVVAGAALLVAVVMIGVSVASQPFDDRLRFTSDELAFAYPPDWIFAAGSETDAADHRVVAHLVTFGVEPIQLCTSFTDPCGLTGDRIPPGEASIVITAWQGGTPPVPDPVVSRPFGLDADDIIGGQPAAIETRRGEEGTTITWWQLSPPGFPDQWIELHAEISGLELDRTAMLEQINAVIDTVSFP